ncbi:MAG: hypothetical protein B6D64_13520 [Bacteroidetes bacterium 4484_276]|nr:MAG: hypothetical protein B6D64_13520 [Bacteroidetes bacterium 4484_276]
MDFIRENPGEARVFSEITSTMQRYNNSQEKSSIIFARILKGHSQPTNGGNAARFKWMRGIAEACHGEGIPKEFVFEQMKQYSDRSFSEEAILQSAIMPVYKTTGPAATEDPLPDEPETEQRPQRTHTIQRIGGTPTKKNSLLPKGKIGEVLSFIEMEYPEGSILFNEMTKQMVFKDGKTVDKIYVDMLTSGIRLPKQDLIDILRERYAIHYHPIRQYFDGLFEKYDYSDVEGSIEALSSCIQAKEQQLFDSMFRKHLIRSVEQGRGGHTNRFILVLVSEKQYMGKSEFIKYLNPFDGELYAEKLDTNHMLTLAQNFIVNLEELETFSKRDLNEIKSIISSSHESIRKLYTQQMETWSRTASFWASTNKDGFLSDVENTRWLPFRITGIDFRYNNWRGTGRIDINKVWAEAAYLWRRREPSEPTRDEWDMLTELHKDFEYLNDTDHYVREYIEAGELFQSATQIAGHISGKVGKTVSPVNVGRSLQRLGVDRSSNGAKYGYYIKYTDGTIPPPY